VSSRVRWVATHPSLGVFQGVRARYEFKKSPFSSQWTIRKFRVPRGVPLIKTEFGKYLNELGVFPPKKRVIKKYVESRKERGGSGVVPPRVPRRVYYPNPEDF
jgi:hypothetical protein